MLKKISQLLVGGVLGREREVPVLEEVGLEAKLRDAALIDFLADVDSVEGELAEDEGVG